MNLADFQQCLDANGADLARWAPAERRAAEDLLRSDTAALAALAGARELDAAIGKAGGATDPSAAAASARRVTDAITRRALPAQRRRAVWQWWPIELLDLDFAPAWLRVAVLACVAVIGFTAGLSDLAVPTATSPDNDLGIVVFEPDPLAELRL